MKQLLNSLRVLQLKRFTHVGLITGACLSLGLCACGSDSAASAETGSDNTASGEKGSDNTETTATDTGEQSASSPDPSTAAVSCDTPQPGTAPLRRLTNAEYVNTMVDLIGHEEEVDLATRSFPREPTSLGFRTGASALTITPLVADEYVNAAQTLAQVAIEDGSNLPCSVDEVDSDCVQQYVEEFGSRVYRRPLTTGEVRRYADLYNTVIDETSSVTSALEWITTAMFSSSHFLFRVELSQPVSGDVSRPVGYEMASRLSYLLWQTMPDSELFEAAANGDLENTDGIRSQVKRMASDPKALRVYEFFEQWLDLDESAALTRSDTVYPDFSPDLVELLRAENRAFVYHLLTSNGTFEELMAADYTFANRALSEHYELDEQADGSTFEQLDAPGRAGVLTQATMLMHDRPTRTSIVKRGMKIRTDFLCQIVPAPPATVDTTLPELDGNLSQRDRLDQHRVDPSCAGCHSLLDPVGEIFEGFDAVGRPRTVDEGGAKIVTGGSVGATQTLDGDYASPRELALAMAKSDEVRDCFALQAFRFFYGRDATADDACTQQQLMTEFAKNDYRIVDLLIGLTQSDQFLYRRATLTAQEEQ